MTARVDLLRLWICRWINHLEYFALLSLVLNSEVQHVFACCTPPLFSSSILFGPFAPPPLAQLIQVFHFLGVWTNLCVCACISYLSRSRTVEHDRVQICTSTHA